VIVILSEAKDPRAKHNRPQVDAVMAAETPWGVGPASPGGASATPQN